jgi:tetratricopeptide (TPR) repeat protein
MTRLHPWPALLCLLVLSSSASACLWDFDTIRDEERGLPGVAEILSGRWERHSTFFYEQRAAKMKAQIEAHPTDLAAYDNLAVALEKLGDHDAAIDVMLRKESVSPGEYTTYANLGTFYLHKGDFENGAAYIRKALAINPDAHFGREYVQLKLAEYYHAATARPELLTTQDFFGNTDMGAYANRDGKWLFADKDENVVELPGNAMEGVMGILRFGSGDSPELFLVLGEMLEGSSRRRPPGEHTHLAYRAYLRAVELKHPRSDAIRSHLELNFSRWREADPAGYADPTIARERADAAAWVKAYQDYEDALVRAGRNTDDDASYAAFYKKHPRVDDSFHWTDLRSWWSRKMYGQTTEKYVVLVVAVLAVVVVARKVRRDRNRRRLAAQPPQA